MAGMHLVSVITSTGLLMTLGCAAFKIKTRAINLDLAASDERRRATPQSGRGEVKVEGAGGMKACA